MALPAVIFPDVELWATGYLRAALAARDEPYAAAYVGVDTPSPRRSLMVTVRRDGGARLDVARQAARVSVNAWGSTEQECSDLARLVGALLWAAPDGAPVLKASELTGPSPIADEQPRRFMLWEFIVRGTDLA